MTQLIFIFSILFSISSYGQDIDELKNEYNSLIDKKYVLLPHKGTYFLPLSYNNNPNNDPYTQLEEVAKKEDRGKFNRYLESEFQVSFLILTNKNFLNSGFNTFIGYTSQSFWQIYNSEWSRPFRETNYMPELFGRYIFEHEKSILGMKFLGYDVGYMHQSNGQIQELSRSWDRVFLRGAFLKRNLLFTLTLWSRLPEKNGEDDNPDIHQYKGYGELDISYKFKEDNLEFKLIPGTKYVGGELSYTTPMKEGLRFYTKISHGYGLSLQDYDHESRKFGIGFIISDPLSARKEVNE